MDLTVLSKWSCNRRITGGRTQCGRIKQPRGAQLVIMLFPRNPKWKILMTHDQPQFVESQCDQNSNIRRVLEDTAINEDPPHKEKTCHASKGVWLYATIKTQDPQEKGTHNSPQLWHSRVVRNSNLTFGGYLASITLVLSARSSLLLCRYCLERARTVWLTGNFFGIITSTCLFYYFSTSFYNTHYITYSIIQFHTLK